MRPNDATLHRDWWGWHMKCTPLPVSSTIFHHTIFPSHVIPLWILLLLLVFSFSSISLFSFKSFCYFLLSTLLRHACGYYLIAHSLNCLCMYLVQIKTKAGIWTQFAHIIFSPDTAFFPYTHVRILYFTFLLLLFTSFCRHLSSNLVFPDTSHCKFVLSIAFHFSFSVCFGV